MAEPRALARASSAFSWPMMAAGFWVSSMMRLALARAQAPGRRLAEPSSTKATPRWRSTPRKVPMAASLAMKRSPR